MKQIFTILLLFVCTSIYSQVECIISKIVIENYIFNDETINDEDYSYGPILTLYVKLINTGIDTVTTTPSVANISFSYNYKKNKYTTIQSCNYEPITNKKFIIEPKEFIEFEVSTELLFGTDLKKTLINDYRSMLVCIMPTYRMHYNDQTLNLISSRIEEVELYPLE